MKLAPLVYLANNWISRAGVVAVTSAAIFWLFLLTQGETSHPYLGLLTVLALPALFLGGLMLIPLGIWWRRRSGGSPPADFETLGFHNPYFRQLVMFVLVATIANLIIASQLTFRAVHYMEGTAFCGITCHNVMKPQYTAHRRSAHANVSCVQCHVGPGAEWFVRSKISGVNQLLQVTAGTYPRPVPAPVENLRDARETCGNCHSLQKSAGDRIKIIDKFAEDEKNSRTQTVLMMRINEIHKAHMGSGVSTRFAYADDKRQEIGWIEHRGTNRQTRKYQSDVKANHVRQMDCVDCHNRHGHSFEAPDRALDKALAAASISPTLPFVRREAIRILEKGGAGLEEFYQKQYPVIYKERRHEISQATRALEGIRSANIFPEMNVGWRIYTDNGGHTDSPGCFRCHDGQRSTSEGKQLAQDCAACHMLVAVDESNPKILSDLGIADKEQSQ